MILSWQRAKRVATYETLRRSGYTGDIVIVIDDRDKEMDEYRRIYGEQVFVFSKEEVKKTTDDYTNDSDTRAVVYARNTAHSIAEQLGYTHFIELDDDYSQFVFRFDDRFRYIPESRLISDLDPVFASMVEFLECDHRMLSVAMSQGGDFIGGKNGQFAEAVMLKRKCMNSFVCSVKRPFKFVGKINEDVNTYTLLGSRGWLFYTTSQISLNQKKTQSNPGGLTEIYLASGTYVKSFYSVIGMPSAISIRMMGDKHMRIHHSISWNNAVPKVLSEALKKPKS